MRKVFKSKLVNFALMLTFCEFKIANCYKSPCIHHPNSSILEQITTFGTVIIITNN